jgi:murein DD-endopeptidase MepM/ murein hydrolase activator NlpD
MPDARDAWAAASLGEILLVGGRTGLRAVPERAPSPAAAGAGVAANPPGPAAAQPAAPLHLWFERPVSGTEGNPHIDATYRYGSTMGGNFQQHQGVEFNDPAGTPVRAAGAGTVVFAGEAEAGARTVVILHDARWQDRYVFTTYYHNTRLEVEAGARVEAGDLIARLGNTGRATNDHLHFEVHVAPTAEVSAIVDPAQRFPPHTVNPQLWLRPLPGTGIVAGRVVDAHGQPVPGARIHGLVLPYPAETPYSFAETYADRAHPDPAYGEHFAVGDVPAGDYLLHVEIAGARVERRVRVAAGMVTFVEFAPGPG